MAKHMNRCELLAGAAAMAATTMLGTGCNADSNPKTNSGNSRVALSKEDHRVIIIGSGFGGGVSALRLAQAGVRCTVLERGLRWPTGHDADTFPRASSPDERALWYGTLNPIGLEYGIHEVPGLHGLPAAPCSWASA